MRLTTIQYVGMTAVSCCQWLKLLYLPMDRIPCALGCRAHLSMWRDVEAFCVECLVFRLHSPSTHECDGCLSSQLRGGSCFASHGYSLHLRNGCQ